MPPSLASYFRPFPLSALTSRVNLSQVRCTIKHLGLAPRRIHIATSATIRVQGARLATVLIGSFPFRPFLAPRTHRILLASPAQCCRCRLPLILSSFTEAQRRRSTGSPKYRVASPKHFIRLICKSFPVNPLVVQKNSRPISTLSTQ